MKVATIGTGSITSWFLDCWTKQSHILETVYSRTLEKGQELANKYNCQKVTTDFDQLLSCDADFIYIASPNSLHYSQAKACLLANKHVILEKPFTSDIHQAQELVNLAKDRNLFLFEAITTCHLPNLKVLKEEIKKIEPIHMVVANMSQYSSKYNSYLAGEHPNVFTTKYSGGSLMDLNVYNIHFITSLLGLPNNINYCATKKEGIDFGGSITMSYDDAIATLISCKNTYAQSNIQIQGEKGYIIINSPASNILNINVHLANGEVINLNNQEANYHVHQYYIEKISEIYTFKDYQKCYKLLEHTLQVQEILDSCRKCAGIIFPSDHD